MRHLRLAARSLLAAPVFSAAVVASLGISIAAVATVFSVADAVLFRPLPYRDPSRLVWIASVRPQRADAPFSLPELMDYAERARTVDIAAFTSWSAALATEGVARRLDGMRISSNAFEVLGVSPSAGRLLRAERRPARRAARRAPQPRVLDERARRRPQHRRPRVALERSAVHGRRRAAASLPAAGAARRRRRSCRCRPTSIRDGTSARRRTSSASSDACAGRGVGPPSRSCRRSPPSCARSSRPSTPTSWAWRLPRSRNSWWATLAAPSW